MTADITRAERDQALSAGFGSWRNGFLLGRRPILDGLKDLVVERRDQLVGDFDLGLSRLVVAGLCTMSCDRRQRCPET